MPSASLQAEEVIRDIADVIPIAFEILLFTVFSTPMKHYLLCLATLASGCILASESEISCEHVMELWEQEWRVSHDYSWRPLRVLRTHKSACENDSTYRWAYATRRGTLESKVGDHSAALAFFDWYGNSYKGKNDLPTSVRSVEAVPYIVNRSIQHRIVVVNERHHAGSDRLLTLEMLSPLFAQGYRYLTVETYLFNDGINERGYPVTDQGYYSNDVVYAQMLRSASELGFKIVGYEIENDQMAPNDPENPVDRQAERDRVQAENIIDRILKNDPDAKLLVHCGYSHVREIKTSSWSPMAYFLKELTGIDPLTIDQTQLSERSTVEEEHPWRQEAGKRGLLGAKPVVLLDSTNELVDADNRTDIEVFGLRTQYEYERPSWMRMGGTRQPVWFDTPECVDKSCILEAVHPSEQDRAVPYDRVEANRTNKVALFLQPNTTYHIRIMNLGSEILAERQISIPSSTIHD